MSYRKVKSKLRGAIGRLSAASLLLAGVAALAFTVPSPGPVYADNLTPPPVPDNIQVPAGNKLFLVGHAVGRGLPGLPGDVVARAGRGLVAGDARGA